MKNDLLFMKTLFALTLFLITLITYGQQEHSIDSLLPASISISSVIDQTKPIDSSKEIKKITSKIELNPYQAKQLESIIESYATTFNNILQQQTHSTQDVTRLRELEIQYKFKLQHLLEEEQYSRLLHSVQ